MNKPIYKISGFIRRETKKILHDFKRAEKNLLYYHQVDKDMYSFYNCDTYNLMTDDEIKEKHNRLLKEIEILEIKLAEKIDYDNITTIPAKSS